MMVKEEKGLSDWLCLDPKEAKKCKYAGFGLIIYCHYEGDCENKILG